MEQLKIAASYSGGKDSALALYRAIKRGYKPQAIVTTYNAGADRSWFHGVPEPLLRQAAAAMGIALHLVPSGMGEAYGEDFAAALSQLRQQGVQACVFGDIDIQEHYDWCDGICRRAGVQSIFPLWQESRRALVHEAIDSGFKALITNVDTTRMDARFLGQTLTRELAEEIAAEGADICGENGEYHTFVYDGPIFQSPVPYDLGEMIHVDGRAVLPLLPRR